VVAVQARLISQPIENKNNMDTLTILAATCAGAAIIGLAWIGGYELGQTAGTSAERQLAEKRIKGILARRVETVIAAENKRKPRKRRAAK
jgi:hypothetical protein